MKKRDEILQEILELKNRYKNASSKKGVTLEEITEIRNELAIAKAKLAGEEEFEEIDLNNKGQKIVTTGLGEKKDEARYEEAFFNKLKGNATIEDDEILTMRNSLSSGVDADGGILIPNDQQTKIIELKRQNINLSDYVTVEPVGTSKGSRVIEKSAELVPFVEFAENGLIGNMTSPQFVPVQYVIKDRGGILPIPNNLLKDSKANLSSYLNKWLAKKSTATENNLILTEISKLTKTPISSIDDIKYIFNVLLDPSISVRAKVFTNQDGFNHLDGLKDSQGNYLLEKDPKDSTKKIVSGKEIIVLSNEILKTTGGKAPLICGSLKDGIVLFDRQAMSLLSSNIAAGAYENNLTNIRAIVRHDVKTLDSKAMVYGEITITVPQRQNNTEE